VDLSSPTTRSCSGRRPPSSSRTPARWPTVREWAEKEPAGIPARVVAPGAELGWTSLLVAEEHGGGQRLGPWPGRPGPGGRGDGPAGCRRDRWFRPTWWRPRCPGGERRSSADHLAGLISGETHRRVVPGGTGPGRRRTSAHGVAQAGRRPSCSMGKGPVEAGAEADCAARHRPVDGAVAQFVVPGTTPGCHRGGRRHHRPGPALRLPCGSTGVRWRRGRAR
jgi:hypothetical protein